MSSGPDALLMTAQEMLPSERWRQRLAPRADPSRRPEWPEERDDCPALLPRRAAEGDESLIDSHGLFDRRPCFLSDPPHGR